MDQLTRSEVDKVLAEYFPRGTWSRKETSDSWTDTLSVGFLELQVTVQESNKRIGLSSRHKTILAGTILIEVSGVRAGDGSRALLWRATNSQLPGLKKILLEARMVLLGLAAGILMITDQEVVPLAAPAKSDKAMDWAAAFDGSPKIPKWPDDQ